MRQHAPAADDALLDAAEAGHSAGRRAAAAIPDAAPLNPEQRAWLAGFVSGLLTGPVDGDRAAPLEGRVHTRVAGNWGAAQGSREPAAARIAQVQSLPFEAGELYAVDLERGASGLVYGGGDAVAVWPSNDPDAVRQVLRLLGVRGQAVVVTPAGREPAWRALMDRYDLTHTSPQLFELLAEAAGSSDEARNLRALAAEPRSSRRELASVLRRFPSARPALRELMSCLDLLTPSYHPLASSRSVAERLTFTAEVHCTEPPTRLGVAPEFVARSLRVGEWINVSIVPEPRTRVPDDVAAPLVLIAEGSGLARIRACVAERAAASAVGRTWVLCAECGAAGYPFRQELEQWRDTGVVTRLSATTGALGALLLEQSDPLGRWLVDRALVVISAPEPEQRASAVEALTAIHQRLWRLDSAGARSRIAELAAAERLVVHEW